MSRVRIRADRWVCDGCDWTVIIPADADDEPPFGYHGTVALVGAFGGTGRREFYAHTDHCIAGAVTGVLADPERTDDQ